MEIVVAVGLLAVAIAAGAYFISSIESDKPWARDLARAYAVLNAQSVMFDQPAQEATRTSLQSGDKFNGRDADSDASHEAPRMVA